MPPVNNVCCPQTRAYTLHWLSPFTSKLMIIALHHQFLCIGKSLDMFKAKTVLYRYGSLSGVALAPRRLSPLLVINPDEEGSQNKGFNYMWDTRHGAAYSGLSDPEEAHPRWNSFKSACNESGMTPSIIKGTAICNKPHGPFGTMTNQFSSQECLEQNQLKVFYF